MYVYLNEETPMIEIESLQQVLSSVGCWYLDNSHDDMTEDTRMAWAKKEIKDLREVLGNPTSSVIPIATIYSVRGMYMAAAAIAGMKYGQNDAMDIVKQDLQEDAIRAVNQVLKGINKELLNSWDLQVLEALDSLPKQTNSTYECLSKFYHGLTVTTNMSQQPSFKMLEELFRNPDEMNYHRLLHHLVEIYIYYLGLYDDPYCEDSDPVETSRIVSELRQGERDLLKIAERMFVNTINPID